MTCLKGQWYNIKSLETGMVIMECKDGAWQPLGEDDVIVNEGR